MAVALAVFVVPMLIRHLLPGQPRRLVRVALAATQQAEIAFQNKAQDLALGGMLFVPEGDGPFPAAFIIHGSGPSRRDNGWYLILTKHLQVSGIVVLLPDKRVSEKSEVDWRTSSFEDLATDTRCGPESTGAAIGRSFWQGVTVQSRALFGAEDTNVPTAERARRLNELANPRIRVVVFEGSGHALESPPGSGSAIIRDEALREISGFIQRADLR